MDDFGDDYQTIDWWLNCDQYMASMSTYGFADDALVDHCVRHCIDYAAVEV